MTFGLSTDAVGSRGATTLAAAANAGDTNIKVASVTDLAPGQPITIDTGAGAGDAHDLGGRHRRARAAPA